MPDHATPAIPSVARHARRTTHNEHMPLTKIGRAITRALTALEERLARTAVRDAHELDALRHDGHCLGLTPNQTDETIQTWLRVCSHYGIPPEWEMIRGALVRRAMRDEWRAEVER